MCVASTQIMTLPAIDISCMKQEEKLELAASLEKEKERQARLKSEDDEINTYLAIGRVVMTRIGRSELIGEAQRRVLYILVLSCSFCQL
jgi:hypothetical protein